MKRYAFIDVLNTANSAEKMLGFSVDWKKLVEYLKHKQSCTEVYLYNGIEHGDTETAEEFDSISKMNCCVVRSKPVFAYKNKDKIVTKKCLECQEENLFTINMGYTKKSNCDVELSVDVMEKAGSGVELMIYTGDGDFEYLIRKALEKKVDRVYVISYAGKDIIAGMTVSRFSTKLRSLIAEYPNKVVYVSLKDIKHAIKRDIST